MIRRTLAYIKKSPGFAAVVAVAIFEAAMNGTFGWVMGQSYLMGPWVLGGVLVANEAVKVTTAERLGDARAAGDQVSAWIAGLVLLACVSVSLPAHIGFIGLSRGDATATRERAADTAKTTQTELRTALAQREKLGAVRPVAAIEADEKLECAIKGRQYKDGVGPKCTAFRAELETAKDARRLDGTITELRGQRAQSGTVGTADPQATVLGWFWSAEEEKRKLTLAISLAVAMEVITSFGFLLFGSRGREQMDLETLIAQGALTHPGSEHILPFRAEALEVVRGASVTVSDAFRAYELWAKRTNKPSLSQPVFLRLVTALGVKHADGRLIGVQLRPVFLLQTAG